ncbi:ATP-binding protein [Neobacillus terrae]|uniref:ATP-binding protein n=1 Tax=Neobacillus terrae TaxID=3034837 RepID=UPI00140D8ED7|nr:ATP-binding protein [Neobacillus terrae]NHM33922.1 two-component sensor histidine kinase [Neobacillus terrae]
MTLVTKDLLINFLCILIPLFSVQMFYLLKFAYQQEKLIKWIFSIFPVLSLVLCMLFPIGMGRDFTWDLRGIPFVLGTLYHGKRLGITLLIVLLIMRFYIGGNGFYVVLIVFSLQYILLFYLSKFYLDMSLKIKIIVNILVVLISTMMPIVLSELIFGIHIKTIMRIEYSVINLIAMVITTLLYEVIRKNFHVLQEIIKAEKLEVVSHLAASISHEVRNPLTVSKGFIQMLSEEGSVQKRKEYVNIALLELDRATEIINDYLTFAKPAPEKNEMISVSNEIHRAVNIINPYANMNGVSIELCLLEPDNLFVRGDKKKFQQCLINILKNGIESTSTNGQLHVHLSNTSDTVQIDIRDEGIGMTQEQINRLGEPYFTTKEKGTGLGMMVSFSIIKGMYGNIRVSSEQGKGTCFSLRLPLCYDNPVS